LNKGGERETPLCPTAYLGRPNVGRTEHSMHIQCTFPAHFGFEKSVRLPCQPVPSGAESKFHAHLAMLKIVHRLTKLFHIIFSMENFLCCINLPHPVIARVSRRPFHLTKVQIFIFLSQHAFHSNIPKIVLRFVDQVSFHLFNL